MEGSIASYHNETEAEQANIYVAERDPRVCSANQHWDEWWTGFLQGVKARTRV